MPIINVLLSNTFNEFRTTTNEVVNVINEIYVSSGKLSTNSILLNQSSAPAHQEGIIFYDTENKALAYYNDQADVTIQVGQEHVARVYNKTGATIADGKVVYIDGSSLGIPSVALADASDPNKIHALGIATHNIANASFGLITISGVVRGIDTSSFANGEDIFLSAATAGDLTNVAPTYPNYPYQIGTVIRSDSSNGSIQVHIEPETFDTIRSIGDTRIGGDLFVDGSLTVFGGETIVSVNNLQISNNFVYLNAGNSITANSANVSGLNDLTFKGHFQGNTAATFYVKITQTSPDAFSWSFNNFSTTEQANVIILAATEQALANGISVRFEANTGHTLNDYWVGPGLLSNVDLGIVGNYNSGSAYRHTGVFRDETDGVYKFFQNYVPEIESSVNTSDASFEYAPIRVSTLYASNINPTTSLSIGSNTFFLDYLNSKIGINTSTPRSSLDVVGTDAINLPVGITSQRPANASVGMIRWNYELNSAEAYSNTGWGSVGGGGTSLAFTYFTSSF